MRSFLFRGESFVLKYKQEIYDLQAFPPILRTHAFLKLQEKIEIMEKVSRRNMVLCKILRPRALLRIQTTKTHTWTWTDIFVVYHTTYIFVRNEF